jgi:hypothetical protein
MSSGQNAAAPPRPSAEEAFKGNNFPSCTTFETARGVQRLRCLGAPEVLQLILSFFSLLVEPSQRSLMKVGHNRLRDRRSELTGGADRRELAHAGPPRIVDHPVHDRQPVSAASAAEGNRNATLNQFAGAAGEKRWEAGNASPLLLATAGEKPFTRLLIGSVLQRMEDLLLIAG